MRQLKLIILLATILLFIGCGVDKQITDKNMTKGQKRLLIERMNAQSSFALFNPDRTSIEIEPLCFYKHFRLLKATAFNTIPPVTIHYLIDENDHVVKMDGTRDPILEHNAQGGLTLNEKTVVSYAKFILDAVQTDQGTIRLIETFDEEIFTSQPTKEQDEIIRKNILPAKVTMTDDGFLLNATVLYGDAIYNADIFVRNDGYVQFNSEVLIASGLPTRQIFLE